MAAPDKAALDAILDAHLSNLKSHQAIMRQMRDYVAGIQSAQATPHVRVAEELNQMNQRAEKILQDARRAGELMEHLHIRDSPSSSNGTQAQTQATSSTQTNPLAKPAGRRSKYDVEPEPARNAAKRQRISEHPNLYMPAFPPVLPPFPNGMPKSFQSMRPSWHQSVFPEETKDEGSMQNRIIVANIPPGVDENDIRKHFESIGPITLKHPLRLPRLAETKIHGLTGVCKSRYMATLDLSDYQAANRAAKELDGTHVKSTYYEPIIVRHFCAPSTAPAAGAKHRLSSDSASTFSPSTGPQKRPRVDVDVGQSANPTNGTVPEPSPSSSATAQPKKRQADTVPVVVEASNSTETASGAAAATAPSSGKKPRLDTDPEVSAQRKHRAQSHEDQQTQKPDPHTNSNSITIHPAYASSESLALRSEFDDISNEVDRRLAEAKARREMAHKAVKAKARAGRKRKRSSFMSAAAEDEENDPDEYKPSPAEMQGTGTTTPDDQPRKKKTKTTGAAHVEKKRGIKREVDDGGGQKSASAGAAKVDRRQQRKERMRKNSSSGDGESVYASARASPASPTPPPQHQQQASPAARASKRVRTKTTKEGCIRF